MTLATVSPTTHPGLDPGRDQPPHAERPAVEEPDRVEPPADATVLPEEEAEMKRIKDLPREVGAMLMTVGVLGFILPGVVGVPAVIAGGLVLWPKKFAKVENWFERRFPSLHKQSLQQINRYLDDLENRFPGETRPPGGPTT